MKSLVLTGLAHETDFSNGEVEQYLLVFNRGELRIPVREEVARLILQYLFGSEDPDAEEAAPAPMVPPAAQGSQSEVTDDDDGVDQV